MAVHLTFPPSSVTLALTRILTLNLPLSPNPSPNSEPNPNPNFHPDMLSVNGCTLNHMHFVLVVVIHLTLTLTLILTYLQNLDLTLTLTLVRPCLLRGVCRPCGTCSVLRPGTPSLGGAGRRNMPLYGIHGI